MGKTGIVFASMIFSLVLLSSITISSYSDYLSPKKQLESGVLPKDVLCRENRTLVIRDNGSPACVSEKTAEKKGWRIIGGSSTDEMITRDLDDTSIQDDPCYDATVNQDVRGKPVPPDDPYTLVEPISYSITGGDFVKLCAQPSYKGFKIYLDTDAAGSITLEVPKDIVDQKHYDPDYLDCSDADSLAGEYDNSRFWNYKVEHIAQTDKSRTLKFTYETPIVQISYFGSFALFYDEYISKRSTSSWKGEYTSKPNLCITEHEQNNYEPTKLPSGVKSPTSKSCKGSEFPIYLNYTMTNGNVDLICGHGSGLAVYFHLSNVTSNAELTVDIPWSEMAPYRSYEFDSEVFIGDTDVVNKQCRPNKQLLFRNQEYQTFKIPISYDASTVIIGYYIESRGHDPLHVIIAAVEPFDRSKDVFTEKCY